MFKKALSGQLPVVSLLLLAGLAMAGCGAASQQIGAGMMGNAGVGTSELGTGTMSPVAGYQYSPLSCAAPNSLPGTTVTVTLADMGMTQMMGGVAPTGSVMMLRASPATVSAGQITVVASNMGWRTHELVVLPLAAAASAGQRIPGADGKVAETGSLGEASGSCAAGPGEGIKAGTVGWVTLSLPAGHYELVCNLQNHYADGMHQELIVT
jgi:uncharacterized cupredoxin-like copper-binding protein